MNSNAAKTELKKVPPFYSLDIFRGLAALWVVMLHACVPYIAGVGYPYLPYLNNPIYAFSVRGQLGVVVFFVISGYCIAGAAYGCIGIGKRPHRFLFERVRRIYPPYLATCLLAVALQLLLNFALQKHLLQVHHYKPLSSLSLPYWLATLSITQMELGQESLVIVFWTLSYEVAFYLFVFLFFQLAHLVTRSRARCWSLVITLLNVTTVASLIVKFTAKDDFALFPLDRWWQFGLGGILFQLAVSRTCTDQDRGMRIGKSLALFISCIAAIALLVRTNTDSSGLIHPATGLQAITCVSFGILLAFVYGREGAIRALPVFKPLAALGTFSYSLYLVHTLIQPFIDVGMRKAGFTGDRYILNYFVQIAVSLASGWLFFMAVERHFLGKRARVRLGGESLNSLVIMPTTSEQIVSA